ncbi:MAG: caspase family protein [Defluviicoccus sp.]
MVGLALAACSSGSTPDAGTGTAAPLSGSAGIDQFQIVDCLLPPPVRQIGTGFTYPGRRRAIRTSASDCGIRGGEYVAHDRANYATALKVWLPQAEAGDAKAQTYVGEIYEKGLGTAADYGAAAEWYRKAAEQNYAPAQVNLGSLYERGQGVPRDPQQAVSWYRRASGLPAAGIAFVPAADPDEVARLEAERQRLEEENAQTLKELQLAKLRIGSLEGELEATRKRLRELKGDAEQGNRSLDAERQRLAQQESALAADRERLAAEQARLKRLQAEAATMRAQPTPADTGRLAVIEREAELLRADLEQQQAALVAKDRERAALKQDVVAKEAEIRRLNSEIAALNRQADEQAGQVREVAAKEAEIGRLNGEIAKLRQQGEQVGAQSREIAAKEAEIRRLNERIAELGKAGATAPVDLSSVPVIELIDPKLVVTRGRANVTMRAAVDTRPITGRVVPAANLLSVTVNDVEEKPTENGVFRSEVRLTGQVTPVKIVAVDRAGRRGGLDFEIARLSPPAETPQPARLGIPLTGQLARIDFGRYYAVVIGNDAYQHFPPLKTAVADAQAVADLLRNRYGFASVKLLTNVDRYQIYSALEEMRRTVTEKDNLLIYFAGHGEKQKTFTGEQLGYWLPVNAERDSTANWFANSALNETVNTSSARHILVVADSCYSGLLTRSAAADVTPGMSDEARANLIRIRARQGSRTALTAGGDQPVVDSLGGRHSVFAKAFLDLLASNAGVLEASRLHQELTSRVKQATALVGSDQVPEHRPIQFGHGGGDFLFVVRPVVSG